MLCAVTGYDAVSLQPNAGSQGEYAGCSMIRGVSREPRRGASQRLPHPGVRARHQSGVGADGRHARRRRRLRRATATSTSPTSRRRPSAHARRPRRDHGHLSVDARRVRGRHRRALRDRARARRPGVRRRREPERAGRPRRARASSAPTCRTSTCTRRSAFRTAAAARASVRSACSAHLAPFLPGHRVLARARGEPAEARRADRRGRGRAVRLARRSCRSRGCTSR